VNCLSKVDIRITFSHYTRNVAGHKFCWCVQIKVMQKILLVCFSWTHCNYVLTDFLVDLLYSVNGWMEG